MATDHFRYDLLVQDALRGMVRKVLGEVAREGLPGDHHFLITFRTEAAGVRLSKRMREKYPEEMTIVLQHQFWDLQVTDHALEVGLSFGNVPERLLVPYDSITSFVDPSVQFGLKFEVQDVGIEQGANDAAPPETVANGKPTALKSATEAQRGGARGADTPDILPAPKAKSAGKSKAPEPEPEPVTADADEAPAESAKVVSIDAFRKKT